MQNKWLVEKRSPSDWHMYGVSRFLFEKRTDYQYVQFFESPDYGLCLALDGKPQAFECDEYIYHEAMVHPALVAHPRPSRIFIAGDGDGGAIREVVRHNTIEQIVWVDIDQELVELSERYLASWHCGALNDTRIERIYTDARQYLSTSDLSFDCIISALTEPLEGSPSVLLYTREFYEIVARRLAPGGVVCVQAGGTVDSMIATLASTVTTLSTCFSIVVPYQIIVPSFGLSWGFVIASNSVDPRLVSTGEVDAVLDERRCHDLRYYDGITHGSMFLLPKNVRQAIKEKGRIATDDSPIHVY